MAKSKKIKMVDLGVTDDHIKAIVEGALLQREKLHFQIKELAEKKYRATQYVLSLIGAYPDFWEESPYAQELIANYPFLKFMIDSDSEPTIGDAMYEILRKKSTLKKNELLKELNRYGIEISPKNAITILTNAAKRDARQRFQILKDGRIGLSKFYGGPSGK